MANYINAFHQPKIGNCQLMLKKTLAVEHFITRSILCSASHNISYSQLTSVCLALILQKFLRICKMLWHMLEQRQYKSDSIESKIIPILNLPRFPLTVQVEEKRGNFKIGIIFD